MKGEMVSSLKHAPHLERQKAWTKHFLRNLKSDPIAKRLVAVLNRNSSLAERCAVSVRSYVEPHVTSWLYRIRQENGCHEIETRRRAVNGLTDLMEIDRRKGFVDHHIERRRHALNAELERAGAAFNRKRHGRDRAHFILYEFYCFLLMNSVLLAERIEVTWELLAAMLATGYRTAGIQKFPSADTIRHNIENFEQRCPEMRGLVLARCLRVALVEAFGKPLRRGVLAKMICKANSLYHAAEKSTLNAPPGCVNRKHPRKPSAAE